jgi:membrane-associated phospholipid phosphatase
MTGRGASSADRLLVAYLMAGALAIALQREHVAGWPYFLLLHGVCLAMIGGLVRGSTRWPVLHDWYPILIALVLFEEVALLNHMFVDDWQDRHILAFESTVFPDPPTVWLSRFASPVVTEVLAMGYFSYYLMLPGVALVLYRRRAMAAFSDLMAAGVLAYLICYVIFVAFPNEGPSHTLRELHTNTFSGGPFWSMVALIQATGGVHGNAFPSAHAAGAVVALAYAWRHVRPLAVWMLMLVILMCVGAVYLRYHYASDMVAGVLVGVIACGYPRLPRRDEPPAPA